jgi:F-type H+-transporting ATPase subunit epsilon
MTMHVDIVSAETEIFSGTAEVVVAPAVMGEVGITKQGGEEEAVYVSGGILEVQPHVVTILSDTAVRAHDLDEAAAMQAKQEAEQALKDRQGDMEEAETLARLAEATAQLEMINKLRKRGK